MGDEVIDELVQDPAIGADAAFVQAAKEGNGAYRSMALQQRAGIALAANRIPDAIALLDEAAKASGDPLLSDTAGYKAALLAMESETLEQIQARLEPLAKDGRPLSAFAAEALAMARLQHGQIAPAREALVLLKNGLDSPGILTQRADLAIAAIDAGGAPSLAAIVRAQAAIPVAPPAPAAPAAPAAAAARP